MKKLVSLVLSGMLVASSFSATVFASPSWKEADKWKTEKKIKAIDADDFMPYGIFKKVFDDSDEVRWAQKSIEKLMLKGHVKGWEGKFYPSRSVTSMEALTMALRIMGWEEEAVKRSELPKEYKGLKVQDWAVGYVAYAYEKGILDEVDMMYFKPQEPAKRHEVAKYVIRALGKEAEAQKHMDKKLPFIDAAAVPLGSVGYIYLANELGIMVGDGEVFNPMSTLTRAEMAVLFNNLDDKVENDIDKGEYKGKVLDIDDDEVTLKIGSEEKTFKADKDVIVFDENDKKIGFDDINTGDIIEINVKNGVIVFVEVEDGIKDDDDDDDDVDVEEVKGLITGIDLEGTYHLTVGGVVYTLSKNAEVEIDGKDADLDDLVMGMKVEAELEDEIITEISAENVISEVEGIITEIKSGSIKVKVGSNTNEYSLSKDVDYDVKDYQDVKDSLKAGMKIEIKLKNNLVTDVYAEDNKVKVSGTIEDIITSTNPDRLEIKSGSTSTVYDLSPDAQIIIDDEDDDLDIKDLDEDMEGDFEIVNNIIVKVTIKD